MAMAGYLADATAQRHARRVLAAGVIAFVRAVVKAGGTAGRNSDDPGLSTAPATSAIAASVRGRRAAAVLSGPAGIGGGRPEPPPRPPPHRPNQHI
ncbi:hypothetical protein [Streptomyces ziwulingensis]|uniref:Uncharacterized protein n=1 Tax=Streptomyces ziwulingensis TaxID=1045501 RepID=A0ABP9C0W9_9ACTN